MQKLDTVSEFCGIKMSKNLERAIGKRIKELRKALGLTQTAFAEKLGRSKRSIQEWESGRNEPSERVLRLIEQTFNVNPEWLREGKGEMFIEKEERKEEALLELFKAMEKLEGRVPRAVKKAIQRMYETQDVKGLIEIFTNYLYDIAETDVNECRAERNFKGNYIGKGSMNVQLYKEGKDEKG